MKPARKLADVTCRDCGGEEVYLDVKEDPSVYEVGAVCHGCDCDYGVLSRIQRADVNHTDEMYEEGEDAVRHFFG